MKFAKNRVDFGKMVSTGPIATTPVKLGVRIKSVKITVPDDITIDGVSSAGSPFVPAEWVDYYRCNPNETAERVVLYLHGGAYLVASRRTHRSITWRISKYAKARVLAIDYRMAPQNPFPAALFDSIAAYRYLVDPPEPHMPKYSPKQVSFVGDSAGGGLAIAMMLFLRDTGYLPIPGAIGTFSPWLDLTQSLPSWHVNQNYCYLPLGVKDPKYITPTRSNLYVDHDKKLDHPYVSPCFSHENDVPICPMYIQCGGAEMVRDDSIYFKSLFKNSPIRLEIFQEMVHMFQLFSPFFRFSRHSVNRMGQFIAEQTGNIVRELQCGSYYVYNKAGFPIEEIHDAEYIIADSIEHLIQKGVYKRENDVIIYSRE